MGKLIPVFLKNLHSKGFSIERTDYKIKSKLLTKGSFSEALRFILPELSETAINLIVKEVLSRGSKTIKGDVVILNNLSIWEGNMSDLPIDNGDGNDGIPSIGKFKINGKAFFKGVTGKFYLLTVDDDGVASWVKDDPSKYDNVFIFEQPDFPLPPQEGL